MQANILQNACCWSQPQWARPSWGAAAAPSPCCWPCNSFKWFSYCCSHPHHLCKWVHLISNSSLHGNTGAPGIMVFFSCQSRSVWDSSLDRMCCCNLGSRRPEPAMLHLWNYQLGPRKLWGRGEREYIWDPCSVLGEDTAQLKSRIGASVQISEWGQELAVEWTILGPGSAGEKGATAKKQNGAAK